MQEFLSTEHLGRTLVHLEQVDSTNAYCKSHPELPHGAVVLADWQSGGRGRNGRIWQADAGDAALFSVCIDGISVENVPLLPFACGMAVCDALTCLGIAAALKWPNDVLCENRKLCGILCESIIEGDSIRLIAGIGINLRGSKERFAAMGLPGAISLQMLGCEIDAQTLCTHVLNALEKYLHLPSDDFLKAYSRRCITLGQQIEVCTRTETFPAQARAIAPDGALIVEKADGTSQPIYAADVKIIGVYEHL